jgi:hypothetical protein
MNPGALFVLVLLWPLVWAWVLDALVYAAALMESK